MEKIQSQNDGNYLNKFFSHKETKNQKFNNPWRLLYCFIMQFCCHGHIPLQERTLCPHVISQCAKHQAANQNHHYSDDGPLREPARDAQIGGCFGIQFIGSHSVSSGHSKMFLFIIEFKGSSMLVIMIVTIVCAHL